MMRHLAVFVSVLALLPAAAADTEIELKPAESPDLPALCEKFEPIEDGAEIWDDGADVLTGRSVTVQTAVPMGDLFVVLDFTDSSKTLPDIIYVDANYDMAIGDGERFALEAVDAGGHPRAAGRTVLRAAKVPVINPDDEEAAPVLVSIFVFADPTGVSEDKAILFGVQAWARLEGRAVIDGAELNVILEDRNLNGSYTDLDDGGNEDADFPASDAVIIAPAGAADGSLSAGDAALYKRALRTKVAAAGKAFGLQLAEGGRRVTLEAITVDMGKVATAANDIEATLRSAEWGAVTVPAGVELSLPAGSWKVPAFRRTGTRAGAYCAYHGPPDTAVAVAAGNKATVALETGLIAKVTTKRKGKRMTLTLEMATSEGAVFAEYDDPDASAPLEGIPFRITNGDGKQVHEDKFKFG